MQADDDRSNRTVYQVAECPRLNACSASSWKKAGVWGLTEGACKQKLRSHLVNSAKHLMKVRDADRVVAGVTISTSIDTFEDRQGYREGLADIAIEATREGGAFDRLDELDVGGRGSGDSGGVSGSHAKAGDIDAGKGAGGDIDAGKGGGKSADKGKGKAAGKDTDAGKGGGKIADKNKGKAAGKGTDAGKGGGKSAEKGKAATTGQKRPRTEEMPPTPPPPPKARAPVFDDPGPAAAPASASGVGLEGGEMTLSRNAIHLVLGNIGRIQTSLLNLQTITRRTAERATETAAAFNTAADQFGEEAAVVHEVTEYLTEMLNR